MDSLFPTPDQPTAPGDRFARVAVERAVDRGADEGLTYGAGEEGLAVGERVEVPLGRGNAHAAGIVVRVGGRELLDGLPAEKVKRIFRRTGAALPAPLVELGRWMAEYYVAPLGMVLASMLPAAVKHATGRVRRVELDPVEPLDAERVMSSVNLAPSARAAWERIAAMERREFPAPAASLKHRLGCTTLGPINRLLRAGLLREVTRTEVRAADALWTRYRVEQGGHGAIRPTAAQQRVIDGVGATLGGFAVHLLRGVTGSGKTEVYLRVIERVLERGQTALVLVPEIALTPQTAGRFLERFGETVAVLHSGLSASQRHRQWAQAAGGAARVVVGARSAVFAPIARPGLIVVDEEHDGGYKQDQVPRYHARDVAIKRGQIEGCPVLLASATPSLESWANAAEEKRRSDGETKRRRYALWELTERVGGGTLPKVEVVDLVAERRESKATRGGGFGLVGWRLRLAMTRALEAGGQVILLLNRRGYASYVCCADASCGWTLQCEHCDASMVVHRVGARGSALPVGELVRCHHCLAEQVVPRRCPLCGKGVIVMGFGTQQLEEELNRAFGAMLGAPIGESSGDQDGPIVRVDSDTMKSARDYFRALSSFAAGRARVLLGTQMIAKGLDYPNVRLVGVINADTSLSIPDFRAAERTFQLVSQVAGRAGRGAGAGLVIVQTMNPSEPAITCAAAHDYVAFAAGEQAVRRAAGLPPATRMARIVVRDEHLERGQQRAAELGRALTDAARAEGVELRLLGPAPCPIERIAGQFRFGMEVVAARAEALHRPLARLRRAGVLLSDAHTAVDVDPVALM